MSLRFSWTIGLILTLTPLAVADIADPGAPRPTTPESTPSRCGRGLAATFVLSGLGLLAIRFRRVQHTSVDRTPTY